LIAISKVAESKKTYKLDKDPESMDTQELEKLIIKLNADMKKSALNLDFERAAMLRDELFKLKKQMQDR
jgi:excinuclease ABC subunit B